MQSKLDEPMIKTLKDGPYVGIHICRGDKLRSEADLHEAEVQLQITRVLASVTIRVRGQ